MGVAYAVSVTPKLYGDSLIKLDNAKNVGGDERVKVSKDILVKAEKNEAVESFLEDISMTLGGSARSKAFMNSSCVTCPGSATKFKDAVSEKEYTISGMCQLCQDQIWDTDEDADKQIMKDLKERWTVHGERYLRTRG